LCRQGQHNDFKDEISTYLGLVGNLTTDMWSCK
jgi:hypothetical protein